MTMHAARLILLVLVGLSVPSIGWAQLPAIYAPGLAVPQVPEKHEESPPPKVTEKIIVNKGEVSGRAQVMAGDILRLNQATYRLWGVVSPPMNEFGGYTAMQGLAALIGSETVICEPTKGYLGGLQTARCRVASGRDLASGLVAKGFARDCPRQSGATFYLIERSRVSDVAGGFKLPPECVSPF
jgi:endonuclease YncB( thermonuclease family)